MCRSLRFAVRLDNVVLTPHIGVLTPHIGWPTDHGYEQFANSAVDVLLDYLDGRDVPLFTH